MATTAETNSLRRASANAPISAHPAFPAIVALWFATLLGVGSLAVPIAVVERLVMLVGLAALVPSASPPLGFTAHVGIALIGAIIGALVGLGLAKRVNKADRLEHPATQLAFLEARKCRPISAYDEIGEEGLAFAPDASAPNEHRALPPSEDSARTTPLPIANLPVSAEERDEAPPPASTRTGASFGDPLQLGAFSNVRRIGESETPSPLPDGALGELGMAQLTERLGAALAKRAVRLAANSARIASADRQRQTAR